MQEAIALYQKVVTEAANDEALAAQAQLHVGMCYEKLANQEARKAYQTVVDKYPSQQEAVRIARQRLASGDGQHLYAWIRNTQETEKASLASINVETEKTLITPLPKKVSLPGPNPKVSPDGNYLIMTVQTDSVPGQDFKYDFVLRVLSDGNERVIKKAVNDIHVARDYDSRHIFYGKKEDEGRQLLPLYRCSIETGVEEVFLEVAKDSPFGFASADAKHIALVRRSNDDARIWVVENFLPKAKTELAAR